VKAAAATTSSLASYAVGDYVWAAFGNKPALQLARIERAQPRHLFGDNWWTVLICTNHRTFPRWQKRVSERRVLRPLDMWELRYYRELGALPRLN
jgi:hypothetical protein